MGDEKGMITYTLPWWWILVVTKKKHGLAPTCMNGQPSPQMVQVIFKDRLGVKEDQHMPNMFAYKTFS